MDRIAELWGQGRVNLTCMYPSCTCTLLVDHAVPDGIVATALSLWNAKKRGGAGVKKYKKI